MELLEMALLVVDNTNAMLAYWDKDCRCKFLNKVYQQYYKKSREEILGMHIGDLLGPDMYDKNKPYIQEVLLGRPQVFEREYPLPNGEILYGIISYMPHIVSDEVQGFFVHAADSTIVKKLELELKHEREKAIHLATHDYLTGLPNRLLLTDRFNSIMAYSKRNNDIFCLMSLDIDNFKAVNDKLGHEAGDNLLIEIARKVKETIRESDTFARIGGDEFILLSSEIKQKRDAEIMAARILDAVSTLCDKLPDCSLLPSLSIGIAFYPINGSNAVELKRSSDEAMYRAKNSGKNRYCTI
jgi:diguanylate cyclase (GGDEF)-like protein/PAS domain S-box-containing protein